MEFLTRMAPSMQLHLDATATEGMILRQGAGKLKHLSVRTLWVQSAVVEYDVKVVKLPRSLNHADALCSFHTAPEFHEKVHSMGLRLRADPAHRRRGGEPQVQLVTRLATRRQARTHRLLMALGRMEEHGEDDSDEQPSRAW